MVEKTEREGYLIPKMAIELSQYFLSGVSRLCLNFLFAEMTLAK